MNEKTEMLGCKISLTDGCVSKSCGTGCVEFPDACARCVYEIPVGSRTLKSYRSNIVAEGQVGIHVWIILSLQK